MRLITSPENIPAHVDLFVAGGISNCPDWQQDLINMLTDTDLIIANPRRKGDFVPTDAIDQITWEHTAISRSSIVTFWFPNETLCPITLLELGKLLMIKDKGLAIGIADGYKRSLDVVTQTRLERPDTLVTNDISLLAEWIHENT